MRLEHARPVVDARSCGHQGQEQCRQDQQGGGPLRLGSGQRRAGHEEGEEGQHRAAADGADRRPVGRPALSREDLEDMQRAQQRVGPPAQGPAGHEHHDRPQRQGGRTTALRGTRKLHRGLRLGLTPGLTHRHLGDHGPCGLGGGVDRLDRLSRVDRRRLHGHRLRRRGHGLEDLGVLAALVRGGGQLRGRRRRRQVPPSLVPRRHGDGLRGPRLRLHLGQVDPLGGPTAVDVLGALDSGVHVCVVVELRPTGERTGHDEAPCQRGNDGVSTTTRLRHRGYRHEVPRPRKEDFTECSRAPRALSAGARSRGPCRTGRSAGRCPRLRPPQRPGRSG